MDIPQPSIVITEEQDGTITFQVMSWGNAKSIRVYGKTGAETIEMTGGVGNTVTVEGAELYNIVAVGPNGEEHIVQQYEPRIDGEDAFTVVADSDMTVEKATERYVEGETWLLELENELEMAMD